MWSTWITIHKEVQGHYLWVKSRQRVFNYLANAKTSVLQVTVSCESFPATTQGLMLSAQQPSPFCYYTELQMCLFNLYITSLTDCHFSISMPCNPTLQFSPIPASCTSFISGYGLEFTNWLLTCCWQSALEFTNWLLFRVPRLRVPSEVDCFCCKTHGSSSGNQLLSGGKKARLFGMQNGWHKATQGMISSSLLWKVLVRHPNLSRLRYTAVKLQLN